MMDLTNCAKRYITSYDENNKPWKNIANYGLKPFETAKVMRNGEYHGFEIEAIDDILPIFTTHNIQKAYEYFQNEKMQELINILRIENEYQKHGNDAIHYLFKKWCECVNISIPNDIQPVDIVDENLDNRICLDRSDAVNGRFRIVGIGKNTNTNESVVPEDWIGKEFDSGKSFHSEMDKLPNRRNKPPVTYCCTYGMSITTNEVTQWDTINSKTFTDLNFCIILNKTKYGMKSTISEINNNFINFINKSKDKYKVIYIPKSMKYAKFVFLVEDGIFEKNLKTTNDNTSYLSSLLQKCFRNEYAKSLLSETINKLHYSQGYNLPDQHFARVSGPRQLCWRSYISIIEDVSGYNTNNYIDLFDLVILSYICNIDSKVGLNPQILSQFNNSMINAQTINTTWNWRNYNHIFNDMPYDKVFSYFSVNGNRIQNSIVMALVMMPMMRGDFMMLSKCYDMMNHIVVPNLIQISNIQKYIFDNDLNDNEITETKMRALDMHCQPSLLLQLQGSLPFIPKTNHTLNYLSNFIWNNSSRFNTRVKFSYIFDTNDDKDILKTLINIQYHSIVQPKIVHNTKWILNNWTPQYNNCEYMTSMNNARIAFLLLFGKKIKLNKKVNGKQYDVIISGTVDKPCKIKKTVIKTKIEYIDGHERDVAENEVILQLQNENVIIDMKTIKPPCGYRWTLCGKVKLSAFKQNDKIYFKADHLILKPFDGSALIDSIKMYNIENEIPEELLDCINIALLNNYGDMYETILTLIEIAKLRYDNNDFRIFDWIKLTNNIDKNIWLLVRAKISMSIDSIITIGPVDRTGHKTQNSINYQYEGIIWRMMICLSALYPDTIKMTSTYKFLLDKSTYGFFHLTNLLNKIAFENDNIVLTEKTKIICKTQLWDHQQRSVDKISNGFIHEHKKGFGDASDVGSGKTLIALNVMMKLYDSYNGTNKGFLVMLPTEKLYDTWKTEIEKHTNGFDVIEQNSNGHLSSQIKSHSVVITTMGRCRDHPIINKWILVTIDECLTVQNKEALQTEEAWRQVTYSHFGVLMLSATFFRSRFEKMLYMIGMLNTNLPCTSDYLDTILSESIVCNLNENERKWTTEIHYERFDQHKMIEYSKILSKHQEIGFEKTYQKLTKYIKDNVNYVDIFIKTINKIILKNINARILIYACSKTEADNIAKKMNDIGRYPEKKKHTVLSYAEGTFGLNDLIIFNTILTRPPESDKLPQMKGRLDRHGQTSNELYINYILLQDTIEEAGLYKLEIANNFYKNHIVPLAEFYKMTIMNNVKTVNDFISIHKILNN